MLNDNHDYSLRKKMNHYLLRRKYRILLLILIAGSIYICFQLFSLKVLNVSSRHAAIFDNKIGGKIFGNENPLEEEKVDFDQEIIVEKKKYKDQPVANNIGVNVNEGKVEIKVVDRKQQKTHDTEPINKSPLGIHITQTEEYKQRTDGMFQCLTSKELIQYDAVNDDYCDCRDSSDEPGTSACPNSRFYCRFQALFKDPQYVPGSRVNDGVCDCCDGSDEWAGIQVFSGIHLTGRQMKGSLSLAPCNNTCAAQQIADKHDALIREQGYKLKQTYLQSALKVGNNEMYGPKGVFYQLSLRCFDLQTSEYKYTFCPFKSVTQQKNDDAPTNIGHTPVWKVKDRGVYVLDMQQGDLTRCPDGRHRSTVVTFICGLSDRIVKIAEDERCVYKMTFSTPAAC